MICWWLWGKTFWWCLAWRCCDSFRFFGGWASADLSFATSWIVALYSKLPVSFLLAVEFYERFSGASSWCNNHCHHWTSFCSMRNLFRIVAALKCSRNWLEALKDFFPQGMCTTCLAADGSRLASLSASSSLDWGNVGADFVRLCLYLMSGIIHEWAECYALSDERLSLWYLNFWIEIV